MTAKTNLAGDAHVETIRMTIQFGEATNPNCDHTIGTFKMESSIVIGDGSNFLTFDPESPQTVFVDSQFYVFVEFNSPFAPLTTELTNFTISQNEEEKCSTCFDNTHLSFVCSSCGEGNMAMVTSGAAYNFSVVLASSILFATREYSMPTVFDLEFTFTYSRRYLATADQGFSLPIRINLKDYECKEPNAVYGAIEKMACSTAGLNQVNHCSRNGWKEISKCPEGVNTPAFIWNIGAIIVVLSSISSIALAAFKFSGSCFQSKGEWQVVATSSSD